MNRPRLPIILLSLLLCLFLVTAAGAITVTPTSHATTLAGALAPSTAGLAIRQDESSLEYCSSASALSCGTYTNSNGVFGAGPGVVFSTGDVSLCGGVSETDLSYGYGQVASDYANSLLSPITGGTTHFDVTIYDIVFDLLPGYDRISLDVVFGSEEYPRWQYTAFNDGLGIYLNGQNIATIDGAALNINNGDVIDPDLIPGLVDTGLDGVLAPNDVPLLTFEGYLRDGSQGNHLTIVLGDCSDASFDTVAFLSNLRAHQAVPEPSSIAALGLMSTGAILAAMRRRRLR